MLCSRARPLQRLAGRAAAAAPCWQCQPPWWHAAPAALATPPRRSFGRANLDMDKGKRDGKRAAEMSKLCNEIWSAAKEGGADPAGNSRLALAISKAKDGNVPKANIERAMARAADSADGMEEVLYEVYAPAGVGLLVYGVTDSRNRTVREIKGVIKNSETGGSMASENAVAWQFERNGWLQVAVATDEEAEAVMELAIEQGALDITPSEESDQLLEVLCAPTDLGRMVSAQAINKLPSFAFTRTRFLTQALRDRSSKGPTPGLRRSAGGRGPNPKRAAK